MAELFRMQKLQGPSQGGEAMSVPTLHARSLRRRLPPILMGALLLVAGVAAVARAAGEASVPTRPPT
jgi:hypothetical protein